MSYAPDQMARFGIAAMCKQNRMWIERIQQSIADFYNP